MPQLPAPDTQEQYINWWANMVKTNGIGGNSFALKDVLNTTINFTAPEKGFDKTSFRDHILIKTAEKRYEYIKNVVDILTNADEIWSQKYNDGMQTIYIKYYQDAPLLLIVENSLTKTIAKNMYKVDKAHESIFKALRMGILLYKKARL